MNPARLCLKKAWKALPLAVREMPLKTLCLLRMGRRRYVPALADVPAYVIGNFQAGEGRSYADMVADMALAQGQRISGAE